MSRPKAHLALAFFVVSNHLSVVALAAVSPSSLIVAQAVSQVATVCAVGLDGVPDTQLGCAHTAPANDARVSVPAGAEQCTASGLGAACSIKEGVGTAVPGVASTPDGKAPCTSAASSPGLSSPAACTEVLLPIAGPVDAATRGNSIGLPLVPPSVPVATLRPDGSAQRLDLNAISTFMVPGEKAILTATANASVTGTNTAIEIFDQTTRTLAGSCVQASQCIVAYAAASGVHTFAAFIMRLGTEPPADVASLASNQVSVIWSGITLAANETVVAPGKPVTFTANTAFDVSKTGRTIVIYDNTAKQGLTYCSRGTTCSTSLTLASGGVHEIVGLVSGQPQATSPGITTTWLAASVSGKTTQPQMGGTVHLTAKANTDLTNTPWSLAIYDQHGNVVGKTCKSGNSCSADITLGSGPAPFFTAVIGALPQDTVFGQLLRKVEVPTSLVNIQARSAATQPTRILWGVDSCKSLTTIYAQVAGRFGTPDFWGRYLTDTGCPGISAAEIATAARLHMGLLPIYNDYNCSRVASYPTGHRYAVEATNAAASLGIPKGRVIAIDIEPYGDQCPGAVNVDAAFVQGWFDGVSDAGYAPTYYGNGTAGTEFATAWCAAVADQPELATRSYLWSFQPSLLGNFNKANAPGFAPYEPGCPGQMVAWQYQIDSSMSGPNSDVDHDEALSTMPLWYP
ncbi:MAG TPA: glycoside hydrolase domain-containing protein [Candidatus Nitrosotalea sp.]|nr:glycoside hydrolase domain-containing protein [Candidatus Nitrosotalea sp.]